MPVVATTAAAFLERNNDIDYDYDDPIERINLCNAPRMKVSDLDLHDLTIDDVKTVDEFENSWYTFIKQYPYLLSPPTPGAKRDIVLSELATNVKEMRQNYKTVESELQRQLTFFNSTKDKLELRFKEAMISSAHSQQNIHNDLKKHLDNIAIADRDIHTALPWDYFLKTLDIAVDRDPPATATAGNGLFTSSGNSTKSGSASINAKTIRPSNRALKLVDRRPNAAKALTVTNGKTQQIQQTIPNKILGTNYNGPLLDIQDPDVQLRAYRIDHTLLSTQVKMLQAELDMYDKHMESMDVIGKFLTEHNIWSLLNNNNKTAAGLAAAAVQNGQHAGVVVKQSMTLGSEKTKQTSNLKK